MLCPSSLGFFRCWILPIALKKHRLVSLRHVNYRKREPVFQWNFNFFDSNITFRPEKLHSRQRRAHLKTRKSRFASPGLTRLENFAPHAAPRPRRIYEKRSNLRRVAFGIQQRVLSSAPTIAAIKCLAFAP